MMPRRIFSLSVKVIPRPRSEVLPAILNAGLRDEVKTSPGHVEGTAACQMGVYGLF